MGTLSPPNVIGQLEDDSLRIFFAVNFLGQPDGVLDALHGEAGVRIQCHTKTGILPIAGDFAERLHGDSSSPVSKGVPLLSVM